MEKLVIVAPHMGRSGPTKQMIYLVSELSERFDIEIIGIQPEKDTNLKSELYNFSVKFSLSSKWNFWWRWLRLLVLSRSNSINIFHSYGFLPDLLCSLLLPPKKWVSVARNFPPDDYPAKFGPTLGRSMARVHLRLHRNCRNIVVCSQSLGRAYQGVGIDNTPIRNAVRLPNFTVTKEKSCDVQRWVFLGNLIPRKRVDFTCRFFEALQNKNAVIDIVGGGPELQTLKEKYSQNPQINFHGPQANVLPFITKASILVNFSASEGLPNAVLEGLSAGCICILSDIGPHKEIGASIGAGVIILPTSQRLTSEDIIAMAARAELELSRVPDNQAQINIDRTMNLYGTKRLADEFAHYYATMVDAC